jgi:hypothetical protein
MVEDLMDNGLEDFVQKGESKSNYESDVGKTCK